MTTIKKSVNGIYYLFGVLKEKANVVTRVAFWKIPHKTQKEEDICLKLGRYRKQDSSEEMLDSHDPKSELTLDNTEFKSLIEFLSDNYAPFRKGIKKYIPIDEKFDQ